MIDLFTFATPNGHKISIALEELGLPYKTHVIHIGRGEQNTPEFRKVNPNGKIPAIVDPQGPGGKPITIFESGAILLYLAEKTGKLIPEDTHLRWETVQWVMFQMGGVGPMFGQLYHFVKFAPQEVPYAIERYRNETKRILSVLDLRLEERDFLVGNALSIADVASFPWVRAAVKLDAKLVVDLPNVRRWLDGVESRPAVQRGLAVPEVK